MRTRVKICGFTRVEDAIQASYLGVDAIGLVFYSASPRNISIAQAAEIVKAIPPFVSVIGLFVDAETLFIREVLAKVSLDCLQFHGDEPASACRGYAKPYIKAIRVNQDTDFKALAVEYYDAAGLLLDAYDPQVKGGTGHAFDWNLLPEQYALPIVLAGGLTTANVGIAIQQYRPYAVDVSSGVESAKGIKDNVKMAEFLREVTKGNNI